MKKFTKLLGIVLIIALVMSISVSAFAATQTVPATTADADNATITINNPAKGETYSLYKLFDATVSDGGQISYQGTVPAALADFFEADAQGYIHPKMSIADETETDSQGNTIIKTTKMTEALKTALEEWAKTATLVNSAESTGEEALAFTGLPYGYYVITTTHKSDAAEGETAKAAITVDSTQPSASVYDKNVNVPSAKKEVGKESYSIGDTITYTATFDTTNYMGEGKDAKQVVDYVIKDTLPAYLSDVNVTSITVGGTAITTQQFDSTTKSMTIEWADKDSSVTPAKFTSKYEQGAQIVITYTAKLTSVTNINKADKNTISITPEVDNDNGDKIPWDKNWSDSAEITTYAAALKKTDGSSALAGAKFRIPGLMATKDADGVYTVTSYNPTTNASTAITKDTDCTNENSTELEVDENGKLYIVGLEKDLSLRIFETAAPEGYNKLTESKTLSPQVLDKQVYKMDGYEKYDADGNLVEHVETETTEYTQVTKNLSELDAAALEIVNQSGTVLPSTGGIGTTIFYVVGSILVVAAGVLLITKKRMSREG
jgi:fimbrial isopeptide formation D2 family protein/LPXTG-motif cell wall-anchored protein